MTIEIFTCDREAPQELANCSVNYKSAGVVVSPLTDTRTSKRLDRHTGQTCTTHHGLETDGDLVFMACWGQGFRIFRLENGGTVNLLYNDSAPVGNSNINAVAVHRPSKQAFCGNYNANGLVIYDYSTDPTSPTKEVLNEGNSSIPFDRFGETYYSGICVAGDWLYIAPYDKSYTKIVRMHCTTRVFEEISIQNYTFESYRNHLYYDSVNDQVFYLSSHAVDTDMFVVKNASAVTPTAYGLNLGGTGWGWRGRGSGVVVDPNNENILYTCIQYRFVKIDITPVINATATTFDVIGGETGELFANYPFYGTGYGRLAPHPERPNEIILLAERGGFRIGGRFDKTHNRIVGIDREELNKGGKVEPPMNTADYMSEPKIGTSADGTDYIVIGVYGGQNGLVVFPTNDGVFDLINGRIDWGNFQLTGAPDISHCKVNGLIKDETYWESTGSRLDIWVSNNGGTSWEKYNPSTQALHKFSSVGNQLRLRLFLNCLPDNATYVHAKYGLSIMGVSKNYTPERPTRRAFQRLRRGA